MGARKIPVAWLATHKCPHYRTLGGTPCDDCVPPDLEAERECEQYCAPLHPDIAEMLAIESGALVLVRQIALFVAGWPVVTAISFVPDAPFGESGDDWKEVAIDTLAVTGGHTLTSWGYTAGLTGKAATPACITHGFPVGTEVPVTLYTEPFKVWIEHRKDRECRAGLILLVRCDRARMQSRGGFPELVLRKKFIATLKD